MNCSREALTVLVVDDNPDFLEIVESILRGPGLGFQVQAVESGTAALGCLEHQTPFDRVRTPAFVVLDFRLPDVNAPVVLRHMRESEALRPIPVLVVSQANWEADQVAALEAGAQAFHVKPSRVGQLNHILLQFWNDYGDST